MASGPSDVMTNQESAGTTEEPTGKKKSRFQAFKNFFAKKKRKEASAPDDDRGLKSSQSSDNVSEPGHFIQSEKERGSGSKINLGNKALSHDSVFVSESPLSEVTAVLGASQDSIHGKVKVLQHQLKQAIGLGSPPSLMYVKKLDDAGTVSEDDGLPCSPPEYSTLHTVLSGASHRSSLIQRNSSLSLEGTDSDEDQMSCKAGSRSIIPRVSLPIDFSLPAVPVGCLDNSAARHRLALRHKACVKTRKPTTRVDGRTDPMVFKEEGLTVVIIHPVEENEEDVEPTQAGALEEADEEEEQNIKRSRTNKEEEDDLGDQQEMSHTQDAPSPWILCDSGSEECLPGQAESPAAQPPLQTQTTPSTGSLDSLALSTGDDDDFLLAPGCEPAEEGGSLLQEVLKSLKGPLTSGLGLETEEVLQEVTVRDSDAGKELPNHTELLLQLEDSTPQLEACAPSDGHAYPAKAQERMEEHCEYEDELVVEHFQPKEEEEEEEINREYLSEDQDTPLVVMGKEEDIGEERGVSEEWDVSKEEADVKDNNNEAEVENEEAVAEKDAEHEQKREEDKEEEEEEMRKENVEETVFEAPGQAAIQKEEGVSPPSVDEGPEQVPDNDTDPGRTGKESPKSHTELPGQAVTEQTYASQLQNSRTSALVFHDWPENSAAIRQDQEEPSVTTLSASASSVQSSYEEPSVTSLSASASPVQSSYEEPSVTSLCASASPVQSSYEEPSVTSLSASASPVQSSYEEPSVTSLCASASPVQSSYEEPSVTSLCASANPVQSSHEEPSVTSLCVSASPVQSSYEEPSVTSLSASASPVQSSYEELSVTSLSASASLVQSSHEEPSVTSLSASASLVQSSYVEPSITSLSASASPVQSSYVEPSVTSLSASVSPEQSFNDRSGDQRGTAPSSGCEQSRPRFTIAPAWQRVTTKEPASPSSPPSPSPASSPSGPMPAALDSGVTTKRDPSSREEPLSPEVPASPRRIQSTAAPVLPLNDKPKCTSGSQGEGTPESLFGVRLRKTSLGMLRLGSECETPPASPVHSRSIEPQVNTRPALPRKPTELVAIINPKKTPDLSVGRVPSCGSESPSWISVARNKQRIFKENSLEETTVEKVPAETGEPTTKMLIPTLTRPVSNDPAKPPASSVKVLCSLEDSKTSHVENEGKIALTHPGPTSLAQDEPQWMALAKKKAKAWSEMPQIVQ
ncbi:hypothetical protein UPYG_G00213660 [Umbra pygmaea]|uniref:DUF4592 domain-containing protein n=1 Tax=Umbra pygmaea TaxID=75934 RepID=A0ABD0WQ51_UMBPY